MEDVLIECSPGISGDMLLGALYDLGVPKKVIEQPLIKVVQSEGLRLRLRTLIANQLKEIGEVSRSLF